MTASIFLAQRNDKAYIMTRDRTVAVMDNDTAKQMFTINFADASLGTPNTADGKIYVADRAGRRGLHRRGEITKKHKFYQEEENSNGCED